MIQPNVRGYGPGQKSQLVPIFAVPNPSLASMKHIDWRSASSAFFAFITHLLRCPSAPPNGEIDSAWGRILQFLFGRTPATVRPIISFSSSGNFQRLHTLPLTLAEEAYNLQPPHHGSGLLWDSFFLLPLRYCTSWNCANSTGLYLTDPAFRVVSNENGLESRRVDVLVAR